MLGWILCNTEQGHVELVSDVIEQLMVMQTLCRDVCKSCWMQVDLVVLGFTIFDQGSCVAILLVHH